MKRLKPSENRPKPLNALSHLINSIAFQKPMKNPGRDPRARHSQSLHMRHSQGPQACRYVAKPDTSWIKLFSEAFLGFLRKKKPYWRHLTHQGACLSLHQASLGNAFP